MKTTLTFILIFFVGSNLCYSQTSLLKPEKIWSVRHENSAWHIHPDDPYPFIKTSWYKTDGDTLIGTREYKHLLISEDSLQLNWTKKGAIREEGMQVYYHDYSEEVLLYDFNVKINDTTVLVNNHFTLNYVLDSVGVYNAESSNFKKYYFSIFTSESPEWKVSETWIEGIGSLFGLLHENCFFITPCDDSYQLLCIHENNSLLYSNPDYEACYYRRVTATETYPESIVEFKIFPNPSKGLIYISNPENLKLREIELIDLAGRTIHKWKDFQLAENMLYVQHILKGVYLLRTTTEAGIISKKLVIQ